MKHLWTWNGKYFGYRNGNELRTHDGPCVGAFLMEMRFMVVMDVIWAKLRMVTA